MQAATLAWWISKRPRCRTRAAIAGRHEDGPVRRSNATMGSRPPAVYEVKVGVENSENMACSHPDPIARAVCIDLGGRIDMLNDPGNLLQGSVQLAQVVRGSYVYNAATADANGLPNVGEYYHNAPFYAMVLSADSTSFFTDYTNPSLDLVITSGTPAAPTDQYRVSSPDNARLPAGLMVTALEWSLVDTDGDAIVTPELTITAPVLATWSQNTLHVEGNDGLSPPQWFFQFSAQILQASTENCFAGPRAVDAGSPGDGAASTLPLAVASPNPFRRATAIHYRITQASDRVVRIYDVAGRRVCTLVAWQAARGPVTVRWDGTDDVGRTVARGTYVVRVGAGPDAPTGRLVWLGR